MPEAQFPDSPTELQPIEVPLEPTGPTDRANKDRSGPSRRRLVVLCALLIVGLAGAATLGTAAWRVTTQKDATLSTPARVAGLNRGDSEQAQATADFLRTAMTAEIQLDQTISVVYLDPADTGRSVLLFGGTVLLWQPERELDRIFELVGSPGTVTGLREVPPGDLGGVMKCGISTAADGEIPTCGWADHGSIVMALFPERSLEEAAALLRDIRTEVQVRH